MYMYMHMHMYMHMRMSGAVSCAACGLTRCHHLLLATSPHIHSHSPPPPTLPPPSLCNELSYERTTDSCEKPSNTPRMGYSPSMASSSESLAASQLEV